MFALALLVAGLTVLAALVALGWTPDTTQPGRAWYPARPDLTPRD